MAMILHNLTLFGLVSQTPGFVGASWAGGAMDGRQLAELPAAHTQQEAHGVRLLLAVHFLHVFVGTHDDGTLGLPGKYKS